MLDSFEVCSWVIHNLRPQYVEKQIEFVTVPCRINKNDVISVFKSCSEEDYKDVMSLLPSDTPLPASSYMTYLVARLETHSNLDVDNALDQIASGQTSRKDAIGPAVGCLMATFGTNMISKCIFEFEDPIHLFDADERIELWGLQIPHNSTRPSLEVNSPCVLNPIFYSENKDLQAGSVDLISMKARNCALTGDSATTGNRKQ